MKNKLLQLTLLLMRYSLIGAFIQTLFLQVAPAYDSDAQKSVSVWDARIKVDIANMSVLEVFTTIENQTDYTFAYDKKDLDSQIKVTIRSKNKSVAAILTEVSKTAGLGFKQVNNNIHVSRIKTKTEPAVIVDRNQQTRRISGKVTSLENNEPLPGVNIVEKGTQNGTITDLNGSYSIEISPGAILVFSSVGFAREEVEVASQSVINLVLTPDIQQLQELVVIGYGEQKRGDITSSVTSVKSENFVKGNVKDAGQLLTGRVAGLTIVSPSGDPTSSSQIILRGNTTLLGASMNPLVLIDGVPGDLRTVAPEDIESIDVLKDGSAAAIYGTRGTNGVILVTTRRATGDVSSVEYSSYVSVQSIARKLNLSTAADFRRQIENDYRQENTDFGETTDWLDEISRNPVSHVHNLTFRGGNDKTNYLLNANYNSAQGFFLKSYNEAFIGRADINHRLLDDKVRVNLNILNSTRNLNGFNGYNYRQAILQNPTAPLKNEDGTWFQELSKFEYENPVSNLFESTGNTKEHLSRFNATISYNPITDLKLSAMASYSKWNQNGGYSETKQHVSNLRDSRNGYASIGATEVLEHLVDLTAEYDKSINNHTFKILGGYSYQDYDRTRMSMENWDFPTDIFSYYNIELGEAAKDGRIDRPQWSDRVKTNLIGFFGRLTYNYDERYLLMASLRTEAASQLFGTKNPWGTFPAISAGWRITEEDFMKGRQFFNDLKVRAGYGVTGTQPTDILGGISLLRYDQYVLTDGRWTRTLIPAQNTNEHLRWEEKKEINIGLDFGILKSRVNGSIDYYIRRIDGLLFDYAVPSPPNLYPTTRANVGKMENKGLEVMLNVIPVKQKNLEWNSGFTFSTNSNKLISLANEIYTHSSDYFTTGYTGPPVQTFTHIVKVGEPIGNFYGFKVIGINDDPNDVENYGQWIYEGADGEAVQYTDFGHSFGDKKVIGNGLPKYYASWINNVRYKNFDLSITQRGAFKFQVGNFQRMMYENPTFTQYNLLKSAFDPVFGKASLKSPQEFNSYYIEDGDYWKIDNITIGYNFQNIGKNFISSARIYVSSLNTLILTGYKGIDPEVSLAPPGTSSQSGININSGVGLSPGIDQRDKYPTMRTFTMGLNVTF